VPPGVYELSAMFLKTPVDRAQAMTGPRPTLGSARQDVTGPEEASQSTEPINVGTVTVKIQ